MLATIVDPGYKIAVFLHILAVVLAFGPTFGYALFFSVVPQHPRATPAILAGVQKCDRYLVNPGMIVLLLAGIYLLLDGPWETSDAFISVGFLAILVLFGLQHAFFQPQVRRGEGAGRTRPEGGRHAQRRVRSARASGSAKSARSPA